MKARLLHFHMRVRTRNALVIGGVVTIAIGGFFYPLVYLKSFAADTMQHSAQNALPNGHNVRGAFVNSGTHFLPHLPSLIFLAVLLHLFTSLSTPNAHFGTP